MNEVDKLYQTLYCLGFLSEPGLTLLSSPCLWIWEDFWLTLIDIRRNSYKEMELENNLLSLNAVVVLGWGRNEESTEGQRLSELQIDIFILDMSMTRIDEYQPLTVLLRESAVLQEAGWLRLVLGQLMSLLGLLVYQESSNFMQIKENSLSHPEIS